MRKAILVPSQSVKDTGLVLVDDAQVNGSRGSILIVFVVH